MSDKKIIIRNCPAYNEKGCLYSAAIFPDESMQNRYITFAVPCQDCTDCVLKQIVELCKGVENIENVETLYDAAKSGIFLQANRILKLLDIQECE